MLFSVIVPVYGVEAYLRQCVDSILNQSDQDWELILVDDSSPDGCPAICDEYAAQDGRVHALHRSNGGPAAARKTGLAMAQGEYVVYVDGDDWLTEDALAYLRGLAEQYHPDVILPAKQRESSERVKVMKEELPEGFYSGESMKAQVKPRILMDKDMKRLAFQQIGIAVRRTLMLPCQMSVDDGIKLGEDMMCMAAVYYAMNSMYVSHRPIYFYRQREGSLSSGVDDQIIDNFQVVVKALRNREKAWGGDFFERVDRYIAFTCFIFMERTALAKARQELGRLKRRMGDPLIREGLLRARFGKIGLKRKTTLWLMKRNRFRLAYDFLRVYETMKRPVRAVLDTKRSALT